MTIAQLYERYLQHPSVQTDTRKLRQGDLFFALKGPSFNGNTFASKALEQGAAYAIIDEAPTDANLPPDHSHRLILVEDVLTTLQQLALHHRKQFNIPFIAITGSNGKTTTKELVYTVLASTYTTYTTQGNLNNHIGIPLTILSVKKDAQFAVIEMGANHQKEIEGYCKYTLPTHGIITNAGKAHLEGFGGPEGVKKGKGELYDFLRSDQVPALTGPTTSTATGPSGTSTGGTAFVMWDYDYLRTMSQGIPHIIRYGTHDADVTGTVKPGTTDSSFLHVALTGGPTIHTQLVGDYNLPNVLVAVAVGKHFNVADEAIKAAIESYTPSNSRSQLIQKDSNHIILDAYNANPSSMRAAIENFAKLVPAGISASPEPTNNKILILGAMAELGEESLNEHKNIVDLIGQYPWKEVILVGGDFQKLQHPYKRFDNSQQAAAWMKTTNPKDAYILIKGSRSTKMEEVINQ
ncbi:UDP-N-acetylmuramoyl-tripeptide--D-alanyl-D-alanine ligase [Flavitalea sp. BT771]|uniref:UDP-N-acetylmuramoyl-tripeptide--D-alanyl-D- alanine ligase n=1 Tax=Flavitalea sp. BT771 TaxID=3063329 RepID=UPI0026E41A09|nr:UDP-N-acetylmuramoyl-tripeptide--D-alanyl-D-alanine ligase [Flavitalea sp. BT771]MDO6432933.1 UDP-N-acetylmuramoyl-tripeptide--D-alanyl-D-alanine ligase [Flavitalea sp. BT771]MDV6221791.1 UDP-N-acetylmuramoyl-tripeptide--D-alanyl-D-alanine ligase [Flavitalea sp. BT771]